MQKKEANPLRRRRRMRQLIGLAVCILVIIGIGTIISGGISLTKKLTDNSAEKAEYETRLLSLVPYDPLPFDTLAEANQSTLLAASIWGTLGDTADKGNFERDELDQLYLPTIDVDRWAAKLFGPDYKLQHNTFEDHGMLYTYVEEKQAYLMPITSAMMDFSPRVIDIKREKNTKRVTVGYLSPFTAGGELNMSGVLEPVKYQDYIFTKNDKEYFLSAIEESKTKVPDSTSGAQTTSTPQEIIDPGAFIEDAAQANSTTPTSDVAPNSTVATE